MGALDGLKILDFSTLLPGPYATLVLADLGAEVLKISCKDKYDMVVNWPPVIEGTDVTASQAWLGRNKKTIFLNLKKPEAVEAVKKLVMEYDIVLEQFRPGVMKKLGVDYETLSKVNPRLIYCSLTGYGQTGPLCHHAGHDVNFMARSGVLACAGRKSTGPVLTNMQVGDVAVGSMNSVVSILAAVYYREKTGRGQYIDVSMMDGMIPFNSMDGACYLAGGREPQREEQYLNGGGIYDLYETKDGEYMSVASAEPKFFRALCETLGYPDWADGEILKTDLPLVKDTFRLEFKTKTRAEWTEIFAGSDACVEPVMPISEVKADPQVAARNMMPQVPIEGTDGLTVQQLGSPFRLSECPPEYKHAGYPEGANTEEILGKLGYTKEQIWQDLN